jgi:hypothetical protein
MKLRMLLIALIFTTCVLAERDAEAIFVGVSCSAPPTGTCTPGSTCADYGTGASCTLSGAGSWSVCTTAAAYCGWSPGCSGTYTATGRGSCICYGNAFSPSGC